MNEYTPDRWSALKFTYNDKVTYKILGSWYGGYLGSDSWKLNSGVTSVKVDGDVLLFGGSSGSVYRCYKNAYGMSGFASSVYAGFCEDIIKGGPEYSLELCPEDTDFTAIDYSDKGKNL